MTKSILLADDSATIRRVVELCFGDSDFHVVSVGDGDDALATIETLRPDVVLADVVMPGPNGYEICRRVKSSERPVPVLLLAGTFEAFDHDLARSCGADGCLMKPFESRMLVDRVNSLLATREAVTGSGIEPVAEEADGSSAADDEPTAAAVPPAADRASKTEAANDPEVDLPEGFTEKTVQAIARAVVGHLTEDVVREIANDVVPRVAEEIVRRRIREIEAEDS